MPYRIRKAKCKQSSGKTGSYVLSYKDKSGKKHRACHTSKDKAKGQIAAIEMESLIRRAVGDIIQEELKDDAMKIKLSELRRIIRETVEEAMHGRYKEADLDEEDLDEDEFTYAIAAAAEKGKKSVDIDGEKFPVKMSKDKAKDILGKDAKSKKQD